jgi:hypothetical protein
MVDNLKHTPPLAPLRLASIFGLLSAPFASIARFTVLVFAS